MKLSKITISLTIVAVLVLNQISWADQTEGSIYASEVSQIQQTIQMHSQQNKSASVLDEKLWVETAAVLIAESILIMSSDDLKAALMSVMIEKPNTLYMVGINSDTMEAITANPQQTQLLKNLLQKAKGTYTPHVYLIGSATPTALRDLIKLAAQQQVVFEPANTSLSAIINAIEDLGTKAMVNISTVTLPEVTAEAPDLDEKILQVLPHVNFMNPYGDYIHIVPHENTLKVYSFNKNLTQEQLQGTIDTTGFSSEQVVQKVKNVVQDYRQTGVVGHNLVTSDPKAQILVGDHPWRDVGVHVFEHR